jgi:hypothetical protein
LVLDLAALTKQQQQQQQQGGGEEEGHGLKLKLKLSFLGDVALKVLLTKMLKRLAAETRSQFLLEHLDSHLASLATLRFLLLKRRALPAATPWREMVCSEATLVVWRKAVEKLIATLAKHTTTSKTVAAAISSPPPPPPLSPLLTVSLLPPATTAATPPPPVVLSEAASIQEPTPSMSSFHMVLLAEAAGYAHDLLLPEEV